MVIRPLASSQMARLHDSVVGQVHIIEGLIQSCWAGTSGSIANPLCPAVMIKVIGSLTVWKVVTKEGTQLYSCSHTMDLATPTIVTIEYLCLH